MPIFPFQTLIPVRVYLGTHTGQTQVSDQEKALLHEIFTSCGIKTYAWIEVPSFYEGEMEVSLQIGFSVNEDYGFRKDELFGNAEKLVKKLLQTFNQFAVGVEIDGVYARYSLKSDI